MIPLLIISVLGLVASADAAALPDIDALPRAGIACHIGTTDGELELALASNGFSIVHGLALTEPALTAARSAVRSAGRYGPVSVALPDTLARLPYPANLLNLVISDLDALGTGSPARTEIMRVLAPGGTAYLKTGGRWSATVKARPPGMDDWPYRRHGIDGNAVSTDTTVDLPGTIRWVAGPLMGSGPAAVTAGGRLFAIFDREKDFGKHSATEPGEGDLVARDAFNGCPLWAGKGNVRLLFHDGDYLYTIRNGRPTALDPETGKPVRSYPAIRGGKVLSGSYAVGDRLIFPMTDAIRCVAKSDGAPLWQYDLSFTRRMRPEFDQYRGMNHVVLVGNTNSVYFVEGRKWNDDRFQLVSIDAETGQTNFRATLDTYDETIPKAVNFRKLRSGVLRAAFVKEGVVVVTGRGGVQALDAERGKVLWEYTYRSSQQMGNYYGNCLYVDGLVWLGVSGVPAVGILAPRGKHKATAPLSETIEMLFPDHRHSARPPGFRPTFPRFSGWLGRDPHTGATERGLRTGRMLGNRCAPDVATERFFLHTHMHATELGTGRFHRFTAFRPNCVLGPIIGNGLTYVFPNRCKCFRMLRGTAGLAGASDVTPLPKTAQHGPAYGKVSAQQDAAGAWPMYRANPQRTGRSTSALPDKLQLLWTRHLAPDTRKQPVLAHWLRKEAGNWPVVTPPVVAGDVAVVAVPADHSVVAFNSTTGEQLWRFTADARVPASPTLFRGMCLFTSSDGSVYALRASDGAVVWRYSTGNYDMIPVYGQLESSFPAQSGVLIAEDGNAYVMAGRHTGLARKLRLLVLKPDTGALVAEHPVPGPDANPEHVNTYSFHADWLSSDGPCVRAGRISIPQILPAAARSVPLPFVMAESYAFIRRRHPANLGRPAGFMTVPGARPVPLLLSAHQESLRERLTRAAGRTIDPVFDGFALARNRLYVACTDSTLKCFGPTSPK